MSDTNRTAPRGAEERMEEGRERSLMGTLRWASSYYDTAVPASVLASSATAPARRPRNGGRRRDSRLSPDAPVDDGDTVLIEVPAEDVAAVEQATEGQAEVVGEVVERDEVGRVIRQDDG